MSRRNSQAGAFTEWRGAAEALKTFIKGKKREMDKAQVRANICTSDARKTVGVARTSYAFACAVLATTSVAAGVVAAYSFPQDEFRFAILGDRTGGAVPGVWEQVWRETDADHPDFVITVGDTIQGGDDATLDTEWRHILEILAPYRNYRIFFTPGNHDVWSLASAEAFEKYTKHPLHYSFDYKQAHFTVLDNSRSDDLPAEELAFLRNDLNKHARQPLKFVFSHRPSWILQVVLGNPQFPFHQLVKQHGVQYVIAGHIHQMLRFELQGIEYLSMASSGGHLREDKQYQKGWFFEHTMVTAHGASADFVIKETGPPFGESRVTKPADWGAAGLVDKSAAGGR
jgi:UDP-2,3-diacylglucosamine pyrophosphatase LpxH